VAEVLKLWGVNEDLSSAVLAAWPTDADGALDLTAVAARYQLAATFLPETTLDELRAIGLPALLEVNDSGRRRTLLLRRMDEASAGLVNPAGEEVRLSLASLEAAWTHSAWVIWRNVDLVPVDPNQELTPTVLATLALRLQKLGHLSPPLPAANSERFQQGVRRFQRAMGLKDDGIVGPRTTLALSRVIGGRFSPSIVDSRSR
jgi:general secretion pathway protein A